MAIRYVPNRHLPDKALDLLDEACACAQLQAAKSAHFEAPPERRPS
jgi:ATP-dependent Clp protease ATP-binding subunit ClpA